MAAVQVFKMLKSLTFIKSSGSSGIWNKNMYLEMGKINKILLCGKDKNIKQKAVSDKTIGHRKLRDL